MRGIYQTHHALNILQSTSPDTQQSIRAKSDYNIESNLVGLLGGLRAEEDFCEKPSGRFLNGHFFSDYRTVNALYPIFSPAKAPGYNDIVIPSHYYYGETKRYPSSRLFQVLQRSIDVWMPGTPTVETL
jgi:hypothetical protein